LDIDKKDTKYYLNILFDRSLIMSSSLPPNPPPYPYQTNGYASEYPPFPNPEYLFPPREYALPPELPGYPYRVISPATGSLQEAWRSIASTLSRTIIASWSQITTRRWITTSLLAAAVIAFMFNTFGQTLVYVRHMSLGTADTRVLLTSIYNVIKSPISFVGGILLVSYGLAIFMPPSLGEINQRFLRALKPLALSSVGLAISGGLVAFFGQLTKVFTDGYHFSGQNLPEIAFRGSLGCLTSLLIIPLVIYSIALFIQAGSIGSTLERWKVALISIASFIVFGIAIGILSIPFGILGWALFS
jgi:hypothetical protein